MNAVRTLRWLAWVNLACGALLALFALLILSGAVLGSLSGPIYFDALALVRGIGILAVFLMVLLPGGKAIYDAARHLKRPELKTALAIALNSSVIFWIIAGGVLKVLSPTHRPIPEQGPLDPTAFILMGLGHFVPVIIAWLAYRLILKPTALRAFPGQVQQGLTARPS
jgi:hypothetical protein